MKLKKWIPFFVVAIGIFAFCAFTVIPTVHLSYNDAHEIDVSYLNASINNDTLTVTVDYNSNGVPFEIGRNIVVATDNDFTSPIRMKDCRISNGNYVYEFDVENTSKKNTIFIKPPILYAPIEITQVTVPLAVGQTAKMNALDMNYDTAGKNWFTVESINFEEAEEGAYDVKIIVDANSKDLPRFPKLCIGGDEIGGISVLHFDENDNFEYGEFLFHVSIDNEQEISMTAMECSLVVRDALIRVDNTDWAVSSNIKTLSVISESE